MTDALPEGTSRRGRSTSWRQRYDDALGQGVPLDPTSEPVRDVTAYPTDYAPDHLLITRPTSLKRQLELLAAAAADFGWGIQLQTLDGQPTKRRPARDRARRARSELDLPTIYRIAIFPNPRPGRDDKPVPPVDAWRLLQRARARAKDPRSADLAGISLDHVLSVDTIHGKTNPIHGKTNPIHGKTNTIHGKTNPLGLANTAGSDSYLLPGSGGRQVVNYVGPAPARSAQITGGGRRPVVAILDTGCGVHPWLPADIVTRHPTLEGAVIGIGDPETDPEVVGDVAGVFDGDIDESAGHGTFIAGIVRQLCPEADILAVRVADSQGTVLEGQFFLAVRTLVKLMAAPEKDGGREIDVINLSLSYYHETPDDGLFDLSLHEVLVVARRRGCAVVCSAGNDSIDRPTFPAALWDWPDAEFAVDDPSDAAPHMAIGALNPNGTTALFSNMGPWVTAYAPGAAVISCHPPFNGGVQAGTRDDRYDMRRETIDPDDFGGGYAMWSGTSFAAPHVAALLAREICKPLMTGASKTAVQRVAGLRAAALSVQANLPTVKSTPA